MIVKGEMRKYLGSIASEEQAGRFYDKYSICIWGTEVNIFYNKRKLNVQAKTNFSYTRDQAIQLLTQSEANRGEKYPRIQNLQTPEQWMHHQQI